MKNDKQRCGAKTRDGGVCKNWALENGRCKLHGGMSLKGGPSHPRYKSGLYSKYAGDSLKSVLEELQEKPPEELTKVDNELRLMEALITQSKALEGDSNDLNDLDIISKVIERLVKSKQRAVALNIEENRLVPASDITIFLNFVQTTLERHTDNAPAIMDELQQFHISNNQ